MKDDLIKIENLDPERFVRLVADILTLKGHRQVRIMDGPGDGGRDIHSLTADGIKYLTQCKYHENSKSTCGTREVSELPMAMLKLGYNKGLFATNSRISPQAKREYLDNYDNLDLDFYDAVKIIKELSASSVLRASWYDGDNIRKLKNTWVFPFLIREINNDLSIIVESLDEDNRPDFQELINSIKGIYPEAIVDCGNTYNSSEPFEPYRPPEPYTQEEGVFPFLRTNEIKITGVSISQMANFSNELAKLISLWFGGFRNSFSIRIGKPSIVPLEGQKTGGKIETEIKPITYITTDTSCGKEEDWYGIETDNNWSDFCDARVSEAEAIRLYSADLDLCLKYEIHCKISPKDKSYKNALKEKSTLAWMKSKFAFVPKWEEWTHTEIPEPDECIEWPWNNMMLCAWLHIELLSVVTSFRSTSDYFNFFDSEEEEKRLYDLEIEISKSDFEIIEPMRARHMIASIGYDPLPEIDKFTFITGEVLSYFDIIPSPINPKSRYFLIELVIQISKNQDEIIKKYFERSDYVKSENSYSERSGEYFVLHLYPMGLDLANSPTTNILQKIYFLGQKIIKEVYELVGNKVKIKICTKEYWKKEFGITFGLSWQESLLTVKWENGKPISNNKVARDMDL